MTYMNHDQPYSEKYLQGILKSVKTIAMVGASPDKTKFSYGVLRVLHETGYEMIPVNPRPDVKTIRDLKVFHSLEYFSSHVYFFFLLKTYPFLLPMGLIFYHLR